MNDLTIKENVTSIFSALISEFDTVTVVDNKEHHHVGFVVSNLADSIDDIINLRISYDDLRSKETAIKFIFNVKTLYNTRST